MEARRARRDEPLDPWDDFETEWVQDNIPESARPATLTPTYTTSSTEVIPVKAHKARPAHRIAVFGLLRLLLPHKLEGGTMLNLS